MIIHKSFGLDLGTTNSTASVVKNGKIVFAEEDGKLKNKTIPSILALKSNKELVGTIARNEFFRGNLNSKKSIKREMGKQITFSIGNKDYTPEEISSKIISYCKDKLIETLGKEDNVIYDSVVITVPAYFNLAQKDATRKAAELAGLKVQSLLEEPTAAAINYSVQNDVNEGVFFVFDLGGGTFDISILEKIGNIPAVLATAGNNYLGGDNFDMILARYFLSHLKESGYDLDDCEVDANNKKFRQLMYYAENVKKQLSVSKEINVYNPDVFEDKTEVVLNIEGLKSTDFEKLIKDKIEIDIISECEKALATIKEKYNMDINDITHILMVGGSTKIPYVKKVIKKKYCITEKLKDVICFEPDLSVSAGAAFVANADGYSLEDEDNKVIVKVNAPYLIDGNVYVSGRVVEGDVTTIGINLNGKEYSSSVGEDKSFIITIAENEFEGDYSFKFYNDNKVISQVSYEDDTMVDIIAPTPIQNEDIAIEIIDVEKGVNEKDVIISKGAALPIESINTYKVNEYSSEEIILPVWEGPRHIFNLFIDDLPSNAKIGSKIVVKTNVSITSDIKLEVEIEGQKVSGRYEKVELNDMDVDRETELNDAFDQRIDNIQDEELKADFLNKKDNITRELEEAKENNDDNHYAAVSEKYEKMITEMPSKQILTKEQFDEIGESIKKNLTPEIKYNESDIDNLVFHGKRFLDKGNISEAENSMNELKSIKGAVDLFASPRALYDAAKLMTLRSLAFAYQFIEDRSNNSVIRDKIESELNLNIKEIDKLIKKYDDNDIETPEMRTDALKLIQLSSGIAHLMGDVSPEAGEELSLFRGLVSKA